MKRFFCFLLCLCLFASMGSAFAAPLPEPELTGLGLPELSADRIRALLEELDLQDALEDLDTEGLADDLRTLLTDSAELDDDALALRIRTLAVNHGVALDEEQVQKLMKLVRTYEKGAALKGKAEDVKEKAEDLAERANGFWGNIRTFAHKAAGFFQKIGTWLQRI